MIKAYHTVASWQLGFRTFASAHVVFPHGCNVGETWMVHARPGCKLSNFHRLRSIRMAGQDSRYEGRHKGMVAFDLYFLGKVADQMGSCPKNIRHPNTKTSYISGAKTGKRSHGRQEL